MDIEEYRLGCARTLLRKSTILEDNLHMALGLSGEAGEFADVFKKEFAYGKPPDIVNAMEEAGDMMWYIMGFCTINDIDFNKILEMNIAKLSARYPEKFTSEKALNRDLAKERDILEQNA